MRWAAGLDRQQLVLFPQRLDDAVPVDHAVRLLDEVLGRLDWSTWESAYKQAPYGQPPIHPRVLASILLYGLLVRIRASRKLEAALVERIDFRWLAEGRRIDHTTLSEFRRRHSAALSELFVKVSLVAQQALLSPLKRLAFDGTRIKANNHRQRSLSPAKLREIAAELAEKFAAFERQAGREDAVASGAEELPQELQDLQRRAAQIEGALQELNRLEQADEPLPKRIPLTDPESRITPNKAGGFAANYTPTAGVDVDSGLIVTGDVIPGTDEEQHLVPAVVEVEQQFQNKPEVVLADGLFATGANLQALHEQGVTVYSPSGQAHPEKNPAIRADLTQPVPGDQHERLPTKKVKGGGRQLDKAAFVYDAEQDCYRCPQGKPLTRKQTTTDRRKDGTLVKRTRYEADAAHCAQCPLKALCLSGRAKSRQISRDQFEPHREALAARMATPEGQAVYAQRRAVGERPFAVIKQDFGVRQFLLRGLERVRQEWKWLMIAFNLKKLLHALQARPGPATPG
jgi:transposase